MRAMICTPLLLAAATLAACQLEAQTGEIYLLTYNVAGLPQGISKSNPKTNIPLISPLLDAFDLVLVQEDFYYQEQLRKDVTLAHKSTPQKTGAGANTFGDGLNRFSRHPWRSFERRAYTGCFGADCLAAKGLSVALTELAPGVEVDVYNLHLEAGSKAEDNAAREAHVELLISTITSRSVGRPLLVAGDFNLHRSDGGHDVQMLTRLRDEAGLTQVCDQLKCGQDRVDRVFYRSAAGLSWTPLKWTLEPAFVDSKGVDLSDHKPLSARLSWQLED